MIQYADPYSTAQNHKPIAYSNKQLPRFIQKSRSFFENTEVSYV